MPDAETWIADGTKAVEPVTTETPAVETVVAETQPRGPDGKFLAKETPAPETSATPTPITSATAAPVSGASPVQDFLEAKHGEAVFQIPKGVTIPLKRGETIEYATVEEIQKRGMLELDYRHKTAELAAQRRATEEARARYAADQARIEARAQWVQEREAELTAAQKDPALWESYQEMQRLYQQSPQFKKVMDDALAKRETDAVNAVYQQREFDQAKQEGIAMARQWVSDLASEFPGVDPKRVETLYGQALSTGRARLDPAHVRALYTEEATYLTQSRSPLEKQLADLTAQVEALKASKAAETHNATTQHALKRAATPPVATNGQPAAPGQFKPGEKFRRNELPDRNSAWINQR